MKADQVRQTFLEFFAERGHERVHSSALVPANDPTLLFTNAGMVQFKDVFTGDETRAYKRATTSQKCVRAGGKHNDLDQVGKTPRHHTFFEMLGNFSFGDYFKEDAVAWAWELLVDKLGLEPERLVVTVFKGDDELGIKADDEARKIWRRVTGFPDERIIGLGKAENFWMMGETGPMGPCSEIHYYMPGAKPSALPTTTSPEVAWNDWLEIWNLVFMQFERKVAGGPLASLPAPSIDTGAGLERVASVLQGAASNYDTDLFTPLLKTAAELAGKKYGEDPNADISMRVIADHARAATFLIADGVLPDKTGRQYVLRRIFRRAVRHGTLLGIDELFMHRVCDAVIERMSGAFPELKQRATTVHEAAVEEERRFRATLSRGLTLLEEEFAELRLRKSTEIPGAKVFQLYDTFGFPDDLTGIIAEERGFTIDHQGFEEELAQARTRSGFGGSGSAAIDAIYKQVAGEVGATKFLGYETTNANAVISAMVVDDKQVTSASSGEVAFTCDQTPFYAESGGQTGDTGAATTSGGAIIDITNTVKPAGDVFVHIGTVRSGTAKVGDSVELVVDSRRRNHIRANHSATHLLHAALKHVLGDHVAQKGSLVAPDRLRFDFAHFSPMTPDQRSEVEDWVNREIFHNAVASTDVLAIEEARQRGAVAMFGEKYGEKVRVVQIGPRSLEFCGGTHVSRTGDIGLFKILSESGIAQGVRRVEAVTGAGALDYVRALEAQLIEAGDTLKVAPSEVVSKLGKLSSDFRKLEKEVAALKAKLAAGGSRDLMSEVKHIGGVQVLATQTEVVDAKALRDTGDALRNKLGSGVVVLAGVGEGRVALLAMVSKDLTKRLHAGKLLAAAAEILGGRGGGRPDMAQGGGKDPGKVPEALARILEMVAESASA